MTDRDAADVPATSFLARLRDPAWQGAPREAWGARVIACLGITAMLLVGLMATNVVVNPRNDFAVQTFTPLVDDDVRTKVDLFGRSELPVGTLVLGTSRAALVPPPASVPEARGFNFAIQDSTVADARLLWSYVGRESGPPARLVVGFDSFQLAASRVEAVKVPASPAAEEVTGTPPSLARMAEKALASLSPGYGYDDLRVLQYTYVTGYPPPQRAPAPDGTQQWIAFEAERQAGTFDGDRQFELQWQAHLSRRYPAGADPSAAVADDLRTLVLEARAAGTQVDLFLTPFHERAIERLAPNPTFARFQDASRDLGLGLCAEGVAFFDYTQAEAFGGDPRGFYDGYHLVPENAARLAQALDERQGDLCAAGGAPAAGEPQ